MEDLNDYSGEFRPDLDLRDFSKDFLFKLMQEWARAYVFDMQLRMMAYSKEHPEQKNILYEMWVPMMKNLAPKLAKLAKIEVRSLVDSQKVCQLFLDGAIGTSSDFGKADFEFKNSNHMIMTIRKCPLLEKMEAENSPEEIACGDDIKFLTEAYFGVMLSDVKVKALMVPPRKSPDEIACQWEVTR